MIKPRLSLILWTAFLSLLFISMSSVEQTMLARSADDIVHATPNISYVFDLNGVLFDTNKSVVFRQMGIKDTLWYVATNGSAKIKETFFQTLNRINGTDGNTLGVNDPDGTQLPELMVYWMNGTMSGKKIGSRVVKAINKHPEWFSSPTEQRLMLQMTYSIFSPKKFIESRSLMTDLIPFIKALKRQGIPVYVLSNWDSESFALLKEKYSDFFALFDGCFISGDIGYIKPQPEIFSYLKNKISAGTICFLDDQLENIKAAQDAGLDTIHVTRKNGYLSSGIDTAAIVKQGLAILNNHNRKSLVFAQ